MNSFSFTDLLPPANEVCEGYVFTPVCQSFCSWGGSPGPHPRGRLGGLVGGGLQAHTQGAGWGVWLGLAGPHPEGKLGGLARRGSPGPHPGGSWGSGQGGLRPTPMGGLQAHTCGVSRSTPGGCPGPHTRGWWIPACIEADPPAVGYCCGRYASYCKSFVLIYIYTNNRNRKLATLSSSE